MVRILSAMRDQDSLRVKEMHLDDLTDVALLVTLAIDGFLGFGEEIVNENPQFFKFGDRDWYGGLTFLYELVEVRRGQDGLLTSYEGLGATPSGSFLVDWAEHRCDLWARGPILRSPVTFAKHQVGDRSASAK